MGVCGPFELERITFYIRHGLITASKSVLGKPSGFWTPLIRLARGHAQPAQMSAKAAFKHPATSLNNSLVIASQAAGGLMLIRRARRRHSVNLFLLTSPLGERQRAHYQAAGPALAWVTSPIARFPSACVL